MSQNINEVKVIPYSQDEILEEIKKLYLANGVTDIEFEGSNVTQLANVMSYVVSTLNINTSSNLKEVLLPLATKMKPALFGARQVGYEAHRKISFKYELSLYGKHDENVPVGSDISWALPKNTIFTSNGNEYIYEDVDLSGTYKNPSKTDIRTSKPLAKIIVKEGKYKLYTEEPVLRMTVTEIRDANNELTLKQDYLIPFDDVEQHGTKVYMSYLAQDGVTYIVRELWYQNDTYIVDSTFNQTKNAYVVVNDIFLNQPQIKFKVGNYGAGVPRGAIIEVNALISKGAAGKCGDSFNFKSETLSERLDLDDIKLKVRGVDEEKLEQIKENAPIFTNTANRAVTRLDYIALAKKYYTVGEAECWGGEDVIMHSTADKITSIALGAVWLSVTPALSSVTHTSNDPDRNTEYFIDKYKASTPDEGRKNLANWYLTEGEAPDGGDIYEKLYNSTKVTDDSLIAYLQQYKMLSLHLTHRQPVYLDFDYEVNVLKYDTARAIKDTNEAVFNIISDYFANNIAAFSTEHIISNIIRRVDDFLTDVNGVSITLKTSISFINEEPFIYTSDTPDRYIGDKSGEHSDATRMYLAFPLEDMYDENNNLIPNSYPDVTTPGYGKGGGTLTMGNPPANVDRFTTLIKIPLKVGSKVVGEYIIRNDIFVIEVNLFNVKNDANIDKNTLLGKLDVRYKDPYNFRVANNVMPRLRSVKFI